MVSARAGIRSARAAIRDNDHLTPAEREHALAALDREARRIDDDGQH